MSERKRSSGAGDSTITLSAEELIEFMKSPDFELIADHPVVKAQFSGLRELLRKVLGDD